MSRFKTIGIIENQPEFDEEKLNNFMNGVMDLINKRSWKKEDIVKLYFELLPDFAHKETGKYLDQRM